MQTKTPRKTSPLPRLIVDVPQLGPVVLARSRRARRLSMTVKPDGSVRVGVPYHTSFADASAFLASHVDWAAKHRRRIQEIRAAHENTLNHQPAIRPRAAAIILADRLAELARRHAFTYNRLAIRNQKTRWGSCSSRNNINLNINLARLRPELMDYVIIHELLHTRIKNHGPRFWSELDKLVGNAKALDKELKQHIPGLPPAPPS